MIKAYSKYSYPTRYGYRIIILDAKTSKNAPKIDDDEFDITTETKSNLNSDGSRYTYDMSIDGYASGQGSFQHEGGSAIENDIEEFEYTLIDVNNGKNTVLIGSKSNEESQWDFMDIIQKEDDKNRFDFKTKSINEYFGSSGLQPNTYYGSSLLMKNVIDE